MTYTARVIDKNVKSSLHVLILMLSTLAQSIHNNHSVNKITDGKIYTAPFSQQTLSALRHARKFAEFPDMLHRGWMGECIQLLWTLYWTFLASPLMRCLCKAQVMKQQRDVSKTHSKASGSNNGISWTRQRQNNHPRIKKRSAVHVGDTDEDVNLVSQWDSRTFGRLLHGIPGLHPSGNSYTATGFWKHCSVQVSGDMHYTRTLTFF